MHYVLNMITGYDWILYDIIWYYYILNQLDNIQISNSIQTYRLSYLSIGTKNNWVVFWAKQLRPLRDGQGANLRNVSTFCWELLGNFADFEKSLVFMIPFFSSASYMCCSIASISHVFAWLVTFSVFPMFAGQYAVLIFQSTISGVEDQYVCCFSFPSSYSTTSTTTTTTTTIQWETTNRFCGSNCGD